MFLYNFVFLYISIFDVLYLYICNYYLLLVASKIQHEDGDQIIIVLRMIVVANLQIGVKPAKN